MRGLLALAAAAWLTGCGCDGAGITGRADAAGDPSMDVSEDIVTEIRFDLPSEPGEGTLVPEGDPIFYPTDTGLALRTMARGLWPVAFSYGAYALLATDDEMRDRLSLYYLLPGGTSLRTAWAEHLPQSAFYSPSISWSGEAFLISWAIIDEGIYLMPASEYGDHIGEIVRVREEARYPTSEWNHGCPSIILSGGGRSRVIDFTRSCASYFPDMVIRVANDGARVLGTVDTELFIPIGNCGLPTCAPLADISACLFPRHPTIKPRVVFISDAGDLWASQTFPDSTRFYHGSTLVDIGGALAVMWADLQSEIPDEYEVGYAVVSTDGEFLVSPHLTGISIRTCYGLYSSTSGDDILIIAWLPGSEGYSAILLDLLGNQLSEPVDVDPDGGMLDAGVATFWEGDAYSVLWMEDRGVKYRRFLVE